MSRFGMCFIVAVLVIAGAKVVQAQTTSRQPRLPAVLSEAGRVSNAPIPRTNAAPNSHATYSSAQTVTTTQTLEKLLKEGRWENARRLIQGMLSNSNSNGVVTLPMQRTVVVPHAYRMPTPGPYRPDPSKRLLPDNKDPMYLTLEQDVRMEIKTKELTAKYKKTSDEKKEYLQDELTEAVQEHFMVRQKLRELEVERLEKKLEKIRAQITRRAGLSDAIVQRRVDKLIGRVNELDWDVGAKAKSFGSQSFPLSPAGTNDPFSTQKSQGFLDLSPPAQSPSLSRSSTPTPSDNKKPKGSKPKGSDKSSATASPR